MTEDLGTRLVHTFNSLCPVPVRFGRTAKVRLVLDGTLEYCTLDQNQRKGGGFIFWVTYKGELLPHQTVLKKMLQEYCTHVTTIKLTTNPQIKPVKNLILNVSKDLLFLLNDCEPLQLGTIFPCAVRSMNKTEVCERWIKQVGTLGYGLWCPVNQKVQQLPMLQVKLGGNFYKLHLDKKRLEMYTQLK